ncbi:MAG TPA: hypothetical protein V6D08_09875 [Candidatus Obscuribacterales bacterium]
MMRTRKWEPCVYHRGSHTDAFLREYLARQDRRVLLIAGAGFDPRSVRIAPHFPEALRKTTQAILIREERPNPAPDLLQRAERHRDQLKTAFPLAEEHAIQIFARDNAIIGGREGAKLMSGQSLEGITDVFIDMSALSIGVAFPVIKHFIDYLSANPGMATNLHVVASHNPHIDDTVLSNPSDTMAPIHGFRGGWGLDEKSRAAILWMPQLGRGKRPALNRIFQMLRNVQEDTVVCPILPFPSSRPRLPDELIEEFAEELQSAWSVDVRDLVYADEKSPLDLYRTILRIDDARRRVFASVGGSQIILSPMGSKALSLGALMASLERDFTILHVEAIGYTLDAARADSVTVPDELVHIWLHGDAYGTQTGKEAK